MAPYLCDTEYDEDVAEGGEDGEEDEGEAPVVGRQSRCCCGIETGEEEEKKENVKLSKYKTPKYSPLW